MQPHQTATLAEILSWRSACNVTELIRQAKVRRLSRIAEQLSAVLAKAERQPTAGSTVADLRSRFSALNEPAMMRLLMAPETHYRLTRGSGQSLADLVAFLDAAIAAEAALLQSDRVTGYRGWTALGDRYFPGTASVDASPAFPSRPFEWSPERPYRAPTALTDTVVDGVSPLATLAVDSGTLVGPRDGRYRRLSLNSAAQCHKGLQQAHLALQAACPATATFVSGNIRTLALMRDPQRSTVYRSVSSRAFVGKTSLVNPQLEQIGVERLLDSLIHESIHAHLYEIEQAGPWIETDDQRERTIPSPWTGNLLRLDSYLHACFVWFGLASFWALAAPAEGLSASAAQPLYARATRGFEQGNLADALVPFEGQVQNQVTEQIARLGDLL